MRQIWIWVSWSDDESEHSTWFDTFCRCRRFFERMNVNNIFWLFLTCKILYILSNPSQEFHNERQFINYEINLRCQTFFFQNRKDHRNWACSIYHSVSFLLLFQLVFHAQFVWICIIRFTYWLYSTIWMLGIFLQPIYRIIFFSLWVLVISKFLKECRQWIVLTDKVYLWVDIDFLWNVHLHFEIQKSSFNRCAKLAISLNPQFWYHKL